MHWTLILGCSGAAPDEVEPTLAEASRTVTFGTVEALGPHRLDASLKRVERRAIEANGVPTWNWLQSAHQFPEQLKASLGLTDDKGNLVISLRSPDGNALEGHDEPYLDTGTRWRRRRRWRSRWR